MAKPPHVLIRPGGRSAYLDIETSWAGAITVVGVHRPGLGTEQLVGSEVTSAAVLDAVSGADIIKTYNGLRFDLPVIRRYLGIDLRALFPQCDLMHWCWRHALRGGLKAVEARLGLRRQTAGLDGIAAMNLWDRWERARDRAALLDLLHYNREDVEMLVEIEKHLIARDAAKKSC